MKPKLKLENQEYGKQWLIREIAYRANFTISDVQLIWDTFEQIFCEIIQAKGRLLISGLFRLNVTKVKPHRGYNVSLRKHIEVKKCYRIVIKASDTLKELFEDERS